MLALAAVLTFGKQIVDSNGRRKEKHAAEDDQDVDFLAGHGLILLPTSSAQAISATHTKTPTAASQRENGRSCRNCPNTNAPSPRFAASGSLSTSIRRCSWLKRIIVICV